MKLIKNLQTIFPFANSEYPDHQRYETEFATAQPGSTAKLEDLIAWDNIFLEAIDPADGVAYQYLYALAASKNFNQFLPPLDIPGIGNLRDNNSFIRVFRRRKGSFKWIDYGPALTRGIELNPKTGENLRSQSLWTMDVFQDPVTKIYTMLYTFRVISTKKLESLVQHIGYSESKDGLHWVKKGLLIDAYQVDAQARKIGDGLRPLSIIDGQIPAFRDPKSILIGKDRHIFIASKSELNGKLVPSVAHYIAPKGDLAQLQLQKSIVPPMEGYAQLEVPSVFIKKGVVYLIVNATRPKSGPIKAGKPTNDLFVLAYRSRCGFQGPWEPAGERQEVLVGPSEIYPVSVSLSLSGMPMAVGNNYFATDSVGALTNPVPVIFSKNGLRLNKMGLWTLRN
ncbi:hypothetical protein KBC85_01125 [Candidatus Saccharibacteria bacterium]|nr:hypothetical protein [Candidatus Saccharibacteria bacterium]